MKLVFGLFFLAFVSASFGFSTPLRSDDSSFTMVTQIHDLLQRAMAEDAETALSSAERIGLLQQAEKLLKNAPPGNYHRHLRKAVDYVHAALTEIGLGDPNKKASDYIRSADDEVRAVN